MSALGTPLLLGDEGGYQISRSVRLRSSASAYFNRTPASASNRKTWTWSGWVKRGGLPSSGYYSFLGADSGAGSSFYIAFNNSTQQLEFGQGATVYRKTTQVFRDPSAWYHLVIHSDTTQATASNRLKIYVNGVQVTTFATSNDPSLNGDWALNNNVAHAIGADITNTSARNYLDGYLTEVNFIDGQALTPSSFGETDVLTGVWKPKRYAGTYGTNGFYLNFSDNSAATAAAIGKDSSGNGNNWTPNNISVTSGVTYDSMLDVPTLWADGGNGRGNYCVLSPIDKSANATVSAGNLQFTISDLSNAYLARASMVLPTSGKWYWEVTNITASPYQSTVGICSQTSPLSAITNTYSLVSGTTPSNAVYFTNGSNSGAWSGITTPTGANDVWMVAFDADNRTMWMGRNGTWYNSSGTANPATNTDPRWSSIPTNIDFVPYVLAYYSTYASLGANFGQRPFAYTPPTGFKALNTQNLPDATIKKGNAYFDVALQTGNTTGRTVSGLGFQPDLVWVKNRAGSANRRWGLIDSVRGVNKTLSSNLTDAEVTSQSDLLTAFNSDGFTIGADAALYGWNGYAESYVHFTWKESVTAGFDIVTYTGTGVARTVAHSLGVAPSLMILKNRATSSINWRVYHSALGATKVIYLSSTAAAATDSTQWNNTAPTSSVFSVGTDQGVNGNGEGLVAYLFSEVAGFSKFGSYTGNGSADGPMVYLGFRPRFVMIKCSSSTGYWIVEDSSRNLSNAVDAELFANDSLAEYDGNRYVDFLSNGFKIRHSDPTQNSSGATYIYAAFAENPTKYSLAR